MTETQYIPQAKKPRKPQANRESNMQIACVRWFRFQYPKCLIFSIPNGGKRGKLTAYVMKLEGALAGVPDLCVAVAKGGYHGLYLELKDGNKGKASDAQKLVIKELERQGYKVCVVRSIDQFMEVVNEYMEL